MRLIRELVKSFLWQLVDQEAGQLVDKETSVSFPHSRSGDSDSDDGDGDSDDGHRNYVLVDKEISVSILHSRQCVATTG